MGFAGTSAPMLFKVMGASILIFWNFLPLIPFKSEGEKRVLKIVVVLEKIILKTHTFEFPMGPQECKV